MTLVIVILLLVAFAYYLFYTLQERPLEEVQRKPLRGVKGDGYTDTEIAEEFGSLTTNEEIETDYLPQSYGEDLLVLMAKDPDWLYAYWEITEETKKLFVKNTNEQTWHNSQPVLRIKNLTQGTYFDININDQADSWYIFVGKPNNKYKAAIGRIYNGNFYELISSNQVSSPARGFSETIDPKWFPHPEIWQSLGGAYKPAFGSNHLTRAQH